MWMEVEGCGRCRVGAGEAVISLPGQRETFRFGRGGPTRHAWVEARTGPGPEPERPPPLRVVPFPDVLWGVMELLGHCIEGQRVVSALGRDLVQVLFLSCLAPERTRGPSQRPVHPAVAAAQARMRRDVSAPLTLADLAGEGGVTPAHLIRLFRRDLGRTPRRELNRLRIRRAETLLVETGWTVGEIADRCGFADPPHFSRAFRKAYGKSPGEFRRQHWVLPEERNQPSCF